MTTYPDPYNNKGIKPEDILRIEPDGYVIPKLFVAGIKKTLFPARGFSVTTNWGIYWRQAKFPKDPWHWQISPTRWVKCPRQPEGMDKAIRAYYAKMGAIKAKKRGTPVGRKAGHTAVVRKFYHLVDLGVPVTKACMSVGIPEGTGRRWVSRRGKLNVRKLKRDELAAMKKEAQERKEAFVRKKITLGPAAVEGVFENDGV